MTFRLKALLRDALPSRVQVPLKYHFNRLFGGLEAEMALLPYLVGRGDLALDVGGNRGTYAYSLSRLGAVVNVFEPNPVCYGLLHGWATRQRDVTVHPVGLSDGAGALVLRIPIDESGVEHDASASLEPHAFRKAREQTVQLRTLDSFAFPNVDFIKIDVEGHEYHMLRGALATLARCRPALLVEVEQRHLKRPIGDVFSFLAEAGFDGWFLDGAMLRAVSTFDPAIDQDASFLGVAGRRYISNFLFLARDRVGAREYARMFEAFGTA